MSAMPGCPKFFFNSISKKVKMMADGHGMGRHTWEEVTAILQGDLTALSEFLGEYILGLIDNYDLHVNAV